MHILRQLQLVHQALWLGVQDLKEQGEDVEYVYKLVEVVMIVQEALTEQNASICKY